MKFVIEIEDKPIITNDGKHLFKAKGFKSLVFDEYGMNHLIPFDEEYKKRKEAEEEKEQEIVVGDEVETIDKKARMIVTRVDRKGQISGFGHDISGLSGCVFCMKETDDWKRTGRHYEIIPDILKYIDSCFENAEIPF